MRELVVCLHHRVDVRGIEQRDALWHALVRRQHEQAVLAGPGEPFLAHPRHGRQEDVLGEPADVVGVAGEHWAVRGGPADTGHADVGTDNAVHQRGFARPRRSDQGYQDWGTGFTKPRQQVVVDLAEQLVPLHPCLGHAGGFQRQRGRDDGLAQRQDRGLDEPGVHPDMRLDLLVLRRRLRPVSRRLACRRLAWRRLAWRRLAWRRLAWRRLACRRLAGTGASPAGAGYGLGGPARVARLANGSAGTRRLLRRPGGLRSTGRILCLSLGRVLRAARRSGRHTRTLGHRPTIIPLALLTLLPHWS